MNGTNRQREMGNNDSYEYRVSLIIPIYNMAKWLDTCFRSILNQSIDPQMVEVLMIDDGSEDNSLDIMKRYSEKYSNFKCYTKENGGPAQARNFGIKHATGKYIMYLDPDDYFGRYTIENVSNFFDRHYDEIDVVTYKIIPIKDGEEQDLHFRYEVLKSQGVYDLTEPENSFICHTTMNTCVKNKFEKNVLFSENLFYHEDQKYNIDTLKEKQKIGYCDKAEYYYVQSSNSTTKTILYSYYLFERTMKLWESEFSNFLEYVPYYIQALYINDLNWKLRANKLLPYHYDEERFQEAWNRIMSLLRRCDDEIIIHHPNVERAHRLYWLKMKSDNFRVHFGANRIDVFCDEKFVLSEKKIHLTIEQCRIEESVIKLSGVLKPLYSSIMEDVSLEVLCGLGECTIPVALKPSSMSRFHTHEITNKFYNFEVAIDANVVNKFRFIALAGGKQYETDIHFSNRVPFRRRRNDSLIRDNKELRYSFRANGFIVRDLNLDSVDAAKRKLWLFQKIALEDTGSAIKQYRLEAKKKRTSPIWLYYDCKNVRKDNGYYQFEHDVYKNDGIQRFYILDGDDFEERKKDFPAALQTRIVRFGSRKHVNLFLMAKLIIISFAEEYTYLPMKMKAFKEYSYVLDFPKIVYLQHGVLHAHLPWHYSLDRLKIDKEVISTYYEEENLIENYGFNRNHLIKAGMPRYDYIDVSQKPRKKILYAPTWRRYLIDRNEDDWVCNEDQFVNSSFYNSVMRFINDDRLDKALEAHGYTLDIQLHPIFRGYNSTIRTESRRVNLITDDINATDYEIFITDFSSFVFDFVYLNRKIMYFVPDYDFFRSGMNHYYRLDLPLEDGFGPFVQNEKDAVDHLIEMMDAPINPRYLQKMQGFFMYKDNHQRERIYEALKEV